MASQRPDAAATRAAQQVAGAVLRRSVPFPLNGTGWLSTARESHRARARGNRPRRSSRLALTPKGGPADSRPGRPSGRTSAPGRS